MNTPTPSPGGTHAIVLFAHGARDPRWAQPFEAVARAIRAARPDVDVRLAFLEFMSPDLIEAGAQAAQAGYRQVDIQPMFLGSGGHVRKDLPALLDQLRGQHPGIAWHLKPAIGEIDSVVQAMADAALACTSEPKAGAHGSDESTQEQARP